MLTLAALLLLSQTPSPLTMAAPPFALSGVEPAVGAAWQERFVSRLRSERLKVTTAQDIQNLLGLERQRELIGCSEAQGACLAELAGALGVTLVLSGNIAKSESGYVASIRVLRSRDGHVLASPSERVTSEAALLDWFDATAVDLRRQLVPDPPPSPVVRWVPAIVGVGLAAGGATFLALASDRYQRLVGREPPALGDISRVRSEGESFMAMGVGLGIASGVAILTSVLWAALAPGQPARTVEVTWSPTVGGGLFALTGRWP